MEYGRISGVHRSGSPKRYRPEPFSEYAIAWRGKTQLFTITQCDVERTHEVEGRKLYSGLYLNELIVRATRPGEHVEGLYENYVGTISALAMGEQDLEVLLRTFERDLLKGLGYEIVFDFEIEKGRPIDAQKQYCFDADGGFRLADEMEGERVSGATLLDIAAEDYSREETRQAAKGILRSAMQQHIGDQPVLSRSLYSSPSSTNPQTESNGAQRGLAVSDTSHAAPMAQFDEQILSPSDDWVADLVRADPDERTTILHVERLINGTAFKKDAAQIANILLKLEVDTDVVLAGALFYAIRNKELDASQVEDPAISKLITVIASHGSSGYGGTYRRGVS